jgi:O-antigen/teichoic acid export membrane protein
VAGILNRLKVSKNTFLKNLVMMISGTVIVQVLGFFTLPVVGRLYSPEAFGEFGIFVAVLGPIGMFITMGYELAILKPKGDTEALGIVMLCLFLTGFYSLLTLIVILVFQNLIVSVINLSESTYLVLFLIPIFIILQGLGVVLRYWSLRKGYFKSLSLSGIASTSSDKIIILCLGTLGSATGLSLLFGNLLDALVKPIVLFRNARADLNISQFKFSRFNLKNIAKKFSKYPSFILPTNILARLNADSYVYFIVILFTESVVGSYMLCMKILKTPLTLISNSLGEVYFQRISANYESGNLLFKRILRISVYVSFLPFAALTIISEDFFILFLGDQWEFAGIIAQVMSMSIFFEFISGLTPYAMINASKENFVLIQRTGLFVASVSSIVLGHFLDSALVTFSSLSLLVSMVYYFTIIWTSKSIGIELIFFHKILFTAVAWSIPFIALLYFVKYELGLEGILLVIMSLFLVIIHHFLQLIFNKSIQSDFSIILNN